MNKRRLIKAAEVLENLKEERKVLNYGMAIPQKFDLSTWFTDSETFGASCKTTACAIGHFAIHPWFRKKGLKMIKNYSPFGNGKPTYSPVYKEFKEFEGVAKFFKIDVTQAYYLFTPDAYISSERTNPKAVAKRIRAVMNNGFPPWHRMNADGEAT